MNERRGHETAWVDPARAATQRLRAVSSFLLDHPPLLLPLASYFREHQPVFESAIRGPSMAPAIPSGARLRVQLLGQQPCQPGDVAFYLAEDGYMVHRVVYRVRRGSAQGYLVTCGDNRLTPDLPVESSQVLGTVIAVQTVSGWRYPGPPTAGPLYKRVLRATTLIVMIGALWFSVSMARRLATMLLKLELAGRASVQRFRHRLYLNKIER